MALTDNPMTLTITGDVTVGANLDISIPTVETFLLVVLIHLQFI